MMKKLLQHHQPAVSAYSPRSRNTLLYHPNAEKNLVRNGKKKVAILSLYLILKFWDSPVVETFWRKIIKWHNRFNKSSIQCNGCSSLLVRQSKHCIKFSALFLARCLIRSVEICRLHKVGLLEVPKSIQEWVHSNTNARTVNPISLQECDKNNIDTSSPTSVPPEEVEIITAQELKWHGTQIDNILKYWFGQYHPDKAQKNLWMIASSSKEQMQNVDAEITNLYSSLLVELGTNRRIRGLWCGSTTDNCFSGDDDSEEKYNNSQNNVGHGDNNSYYGWRGKIAAIVLLDQMSRHIHRHYNNEHTLITGIENEIPKQSILDDIALQVAKSIQIHHAEEIKSGMIPVPMLIFALMPYRHASTLQSVGFVQKSVEEIAALNSIDMNNMIRRFRRATNRRMAVLQDDARRSGMNTQYNQDINDKDRGKNTSEFTDEDILEFQAFSADMTDTKNHSIVKTMIDFLSARGIHRMKNSAQSCSRDTPILVSLSGGVDSMVIANALVYLRDNCGYDQLFLASVHVDYGNRPESAAEARFVKNYALNVIKFDLCVVRRINEVTRGKTKRDEYEKVSRNVRYELYKSTIAKCIKEIARDYPNSGKIREVGVMLGHHRGDIVENVISNSNKGCGPLDLSGMTSVSRNDGVTIYRPLLPLNKEDVYDYSHSFGVPYFNDTTPHWSTRGKLRNKLIPLLKEVYGDGCLENLANLAEESDEARELFNRSAFRPFMDTVVHYPMGVIFSTLPFKSHPTYFWKIVLRDLLHSIGLGMFSDKSIASFLDRALSNKVRAGWLQCRRDYAVYLMNDGRVMVLVSLLNYFFFVY